MAEELVVGANEFTEQPERRRYQSGQGWTRVRTWIGPKALADAKIAEIEVDQPDDINITKGVPCVIEASYAEETTTEDTSIWELIPSAMDKALATHPAFNTNSTSGIVLGLIEKDMRQGISYNVDYDTGYSSLNYNEYRDLRLRGVDSYRVWTWTIRKTTTTGRTALLQVDEADQQKVISYAAIGIPDDVKWAQPKMRVWNGSTPQDPVNINEWLVAPPSVRYERKKYTITKEWIGAAKWYKYLYEGGTADSNAYGFNK